MNSSHSIAVQIGELLAAQCSRVSVQLQPPPENSPTPHQHEVVRVIRFFTVNKQHCAPDFVRNLDHLLKIPRHDRNRKLQGDRVPWVTPWLVKFRCKFGSSRTAIDQLVQRGARVRVQVLKHNLASDKVDADSLFHRVADVDGRGKRRGALDQCKLTAVSFVPWTPRLGIQVGGLDPPLLSYAGALRVWAPKSQGPGVRGWRKILKLEPFRTIIDPVRSQCYFFLHSGWQGPGSHLSTHVVDTEALELWLTLVWICGLQVLSELATLSEPLAHARLVLILMVVTDCQDC